MQKKWLLLIVVSGVLTLMGCGPSNAVTEEEATAGAPLLPDLPDTAVPPSPTSEAYPIEENEPATAVPEQSPEEYPVEEVLPATAVPDSYPVPTQPTFSTEPYPAQEGTVWVARPVGVQCETAEYTDIQEAIADLTAIGVDVLDQGTFEMNVLAVCGGTTSAHFRVLVAAEDVADTAVLGWEPMEN